MLDKLEIFIKYYNIAVENRKIIIISLSVIGFLYLAWDNKNFMKKLKKEMAISERNQLVRNSNKKYEYVTYFFMLITLVLQEYYLLFIFLVIELFKTKMQLRNHRNLIDFYESKGYNDWLRNVNKSQENEEDDEQNNR